MELIEREDFLDVLHNGYKNVTSGEGHCYFMMGEPGIGKSAVVKTFLEQVGKDCIKYIGACDSLFTPRPLAPLYDLALQINQDWMSEIQSVVSRSELFTKIVQEFTGKDKPVILVFEDVHWADEATLDFIKFFARRISLTNCMFILTYRDDEMAQQHQMRNILGELSPDTFTRIHLTPLSRLAVYKLAEQKGYDAENVYSISGGNPFYVNEILASYSPGVPENIKDSILAVYDRQEEGTKNAWQVCSVIPEGLEINRFSKIKSSSDIVMDHCFVLRILVAKNDRIVFKHELYRRTIEDSLSPLKRIELNKKILDLFLESFEEEGETERIVHYAKNANENKLVVKHAPLAAKQAADVGAHSEAAKLYLTAIEYARHNDVDELVKLYEAYAYECYLTNQVKEAIIYQVKALQVWQKKNDIEQIGNSLRFLSRVWWIDGNGEEAEKYAMQAIALLTDQSSSRAKAMAFSNMAQLKMLSEEITESIEWGNKAIAIAKEINDDEILCHALNTIGSAKWRMEASKEEGKKSLFKSLEIALQYSFHEHAARAYSNIVSNAVLFKDYELAKQFLQEGINYCEERDLDSSNNYQLSLKARMLMETGEWDQAVLTAKNLLQNKLLPGVVKIGPMVVIATIKLRRGEQDVVTYLEEAKSLAFLTKEYQRIIPVIIAAFEYEWLTGKSILTQDELQIGINLIKKTEYSFMNSHFVYWLKKAKNQDMEIAYLYEPYELLAKGATAKAALCWEKIGCPFEEAMALAEGTEDDKRNALLILQQLGADTIGEKVKMEMRAEGIKKIPRGLRTSTKTNPAQLTNRELDVLQLLKNAVQNKEIAETLFISPKTVDHHISSILFKLDVNSRSKAVAEAVRLGILK